MANIKEETIQQYRYVARNYARAANIPLQQAYDLIRPGFVGILEKELREVEKDSIKRSDRKRKTVRKLK